MADDPIERIGVELEIFAIPQPAGAPPMTETYMHVRRRQNGAAERAVLGLPAYEGAQGPPGPPGAIHRGELTTSELDAMALVLGEDNTNWAWRNTDTNDQYVWSGATFVVYHGVYGTPGPVGPPPALTPGTLTIDGDAVASPDFGVRVSGSAGSYAVGVDLPPMPKGAKGDVGPSGSVINSVDVADDSDPTDGDVLTYREDDGKLVWQPGQFVTEEYVVGPGGFPTVTKGSSDTRHTMFSVNIPAKPWPYRFDFAGGVDVSSSNGTQIDMELRTDNATSGPLVGYGKGQDGEGYREVAFRAHSDVDLTPESTEGTIPANTAVTLYASAVKTAGVLTSWKIRNTKAQLRIRLMRVTV
ncbi:minor tail protein [Gordonia phage Blueberry]|uniref:Minor tail protein n=1 Tax=Gordonia phage Azula TaxID=2762397 RepID=A0A7G8LKR8_9CAUD|nr:minor tail protein [Gordonia phage Blueberry]YP_010109955.1 minor tail protein [Gordonia phage Azula]QGJ97401.1 minor tail protein [Gordonia phage Gambino]QZD97461.1 minor tail protein [Gordonia phage MissRona]ANA85491.1 minor tail protein [Gordonia phage Blueberry]QNJ57840.1 minor tail protein [Gordonia phage Azula]